MENGIGWQMESNGIESNGMDTGKPEKSRYDEMNRYDRWNIDDDDYIPITRDDAKMMTIIISIKQMDIKWVLEK